MKPADVWIDSFLTKLILLLILLKLILIPSCILFSPSSPVWPNCSLSIHSLLTPKLHKNKQQENKQQEFELPPFWLVAVPIEIWCTQSLARSIVLRTFTCEGHCLEHDKLFYKCHQSGHNIKYRQSNFPES